MGLWGGGAGVIWSLQQGKRGSEAEGWCVCVCGVCVCVGCVWGWVGQHFNNEFASTFQYVNLEAGSTTLHFNLEQTTPQHINREAFQPVNFHKMFKLPT